ncbi:hypothetical protein VPHG_00032 [Vibrio phage 11895-B1]|uniref:hypothetical protein n=1 Tax=Vibrio phage 11895-B1 TaxID=754075 RepID=UPI0002C09BCD|nr:hypothetical protein VPHG_00032 [Vibrio phage 11895-B1]AGH32099.1 hypothetical protein VPHG_00032 [Vibrio phage 11895-B1]
MTREEHCNRLCVSYVRVSNQMLKHNLSFEEAVKLPIQRINKHCINGEIKTNSKWYTHFNIPSRTANTWMSKKGRTFRDMLNKYGVDTSSMEIYPCDGEIVMYNRPL